MRMNQDEQRIMRLMYYESLEEIAHLRNENDRFRRDNERLRKENERFREWITIQRDKAFERFQARILGDF